MSARRDHAVALARKGREIDLVSLRCGGECGGVRAGAAALADGWSRWVSAVWRRPAPGVRTAWASARRDPTRTMSCLARVIAGVEQVALQHHPGGGGERDDHGGVFAALGAVDGDRVGVGEFVEFGEVVVDVLVFVGEHGEGLLL